MYTVSVRKLQPRQYGVACGSALLLAMRARICAWRRSEASAMLPFANVLLKLFQHIHGSTRSRFDFVHPFNIGVPVAQKLRCQPDCMDSVRKVVQEHCEPFGTATAVAHRVPVPRGQSAAANRNYHC